MTTYDLSLLFTFKFNCCGCVTVFIFTGLLVAPLGALVKDNAVFVAFASSTSIGSLVLM